MKSTDAEDEDEVEDENNTEDEEEIVEALELSAEELAVEAGAELLSEAEFVSTVTMLTASVDLLVD